MAESAANDSDEETGNTPDSERSFLKVQPRPLGRDSVMVYVVRTGMPARPNRRRAAF